MKLGLNFGIGVLMLMTGFSSEAEQTPVEKLKNTVFRKLKLGSRIRLKRLRTKPISHFAHQHEALSCLVRIFS